MKILPLAILAKSYILDVWQNCEHAFSNGQTNEKGNSWLKLKKLQKFTNKEDLTT